ncbi:MAG TPA: response regulator [Flavobacterium sp.]|jgi:PleD family two-component response regulator|nr:response regulator [Flavobacterium sp.]HPJ09763.1 response regulator [Flavobacterium sp.]
MKYKTIFHVDDDEDDCQMVSDIIATIPDCASYFKSHNPTEALQILDKKEVTPDVILLDYYITTMNAPEFVAQLKSAEHLSDIPIIILSTNDVDVMIQQVSTLGVEHFLKKPSDYNELSALIKTHL